MTEQEQKKELMQRLVNSLHNELYKNKFGYIYCITNKLNNCKYIGLTTNTVSIRWAEHLSNYNNRNTEYNKPLYVAMRKNGVENFIIEEIEKCHIIDLPDREKFWIKYYDTYKNPEKGYNYTIGGEMQLPQIYDSQKIIETYKTQKTLEKTSKLLNIHKNIIIKVLEENNIKILTAKEHAVNKSVKINVYDLDGNFIQTFNGLRDAGNWILENFKDRTTTSSSHAVGCAIKKSIIFNRSYLGFRWECESYKKQNDTFKIIDNEAFTRANIYLYTKDNKLIKEFKSIKDCSKYIIKTLDLKISEKTLNQYISRSFKEKYDFKEFSIKSKKLEEKYKEVEKNNKIVSLYKIVPNQRIDNKIVCKICGKEISKKNKNKLCLLCYSELQKNNLIISRNDLKYFIRKYPFTAIAAALNVSTSSIKRWCVARNLPNTKENIEKYSDEDWNNEIWNTTFEEYKVLLNKIELFSQKNNPIAKKSRKDVEKEILKNIKTHNYIIYKCEICGKKIKYEPIDNKCVACANKKTHIKISRTDLKNKIRNETFYKIAKDNNTTPSAVESWCKTYNLPYRKIDINKISDEDWKFEKWDLNELKRQNIVKKKHNYKIPTYEELLVDIYDLSKINIKKKYDLYDKKQINKIAMKYNIPYNSKLIHKFTREEWLSEKWKDPIFLEYVKLNRYSADIPEKKELKKMIRTMSLESIEKETGVEYKRLEKAFKYFNIPHTLSESTSYTDEEWEKEIWNQK